ncbi:MAG TPA: ATP-grasp domain-containing protein [Bryobacteraceae bacterium]|nr:ATP-grasp domain-containing protein [Bryobacteraceae bacterium]
MTQKVLILDGNARSALAATRSLGSRGLHVVVGGDSRRTLAGSSQYCREAFTYPPPGENPDGFLSTLKFECARRGVSVIFPMTEISTLTALKSREQLDGLQLPFVDFSTFDALSDKWKLLELAKQLNVSIPETHFVNDPGELDGILPQLKFPAVLKPYRSMIYSGGRWIASCVQYANSERELCEVVKRHEYFNRHPFLIQEFVRGQGQGIFALYDHGTPLAFFAHRRLREKPPSGGVSVLSESIALDPVQREMAHRILSQVHWHGVAMVEFKVSADGTPYLIEVNGRFWGSLQLAIDAGVDFPWLLYQLAIGAEVDPVSSYAVGVKWRWLLGDFTRLCQVLIGRGASASTAAPGKVESLRQFLSAFEEAGPAQSKLRDDIKPFLLEFYQTTCGNENSAQWMQRLRRRLSF